MTKTPAVYDFEAIGNPIANERPPEAGLAALWRRHDEMTDMLVDGDFGLSRGRVGAVKCAGHRAFSADRCLPGSQCRRHLG